MIEGRIPAITGIGLAHGQTTVTNDELAERLFPSRGANASPDRARKLMRRFMDPVGIESRYWVSHEPVPVDLGRTAIKDEIPLVELPYVTSDLAADALRQAIEMAGIDQNRLTTVIVGSGSQDYTGVATAALVQKKLGLPTSVRAYDVYAACPGWLQALHNAFADITSPLGMGGPQAVIGAETLSPILSDKEPLLFPLFGDAAGAAIVDLVVPDPGAPTAMGFAFGSDGALAEKLYMPGGGSKYPTSTATVEMNLHTLKMDGQLIREHAVKHMAALARTALAKAGVAIEDVALMVPHQANLSIMQATADELGVPYDRMMVTIDHYGNTSAASIPTALREAWDTGRVKRNDLVVFATFGAGLIFGAAVVPMAGLPAR